MALATCLLLAACGPSSSGGKGASSAHRGTKASVGGEGPRKVDLEFTLNGKPFPLPIVHGKVAGEETIFLVDTGANSHVIAGWLARKVGLTTLSLGDTGTDHVGRPIETRRAPHPHVSIDGWGELADQSMLVTDVPEAVSRLGIGVFLSPQQLAGDGLDVVLDFPHSEMRTIAVDATPTAVGSLLTLEPPHACVDDESPFHGLAFVVNATVEGHDARLLIDTGAHQSDLLMTSKVGKALLPRSEESKEAVYAASGRVTPRTVRGARMNVGAVEAMRNVDLIPGAEDPFCPRDGVLAMDILKQCTLVLGRRTVSGVCEEK